MQLLGRCNTRRQRSSYTKSYTYRLLPCSRRRRRASISSAMLFLTRSMILALLESLHEPARFFITKIWTSFLHEKHENTLPCLILPRRSPHRILPLRHWPSQPYFFWWAGMVTGRLAFHLYGRLGIWRLDASVLGSAQNYLRCHRQGRSFFDMVKYVSQRSLRGRGNDRY